MLDIGIDTRAVKAIKNKKVLLYGAGYVGKKIYFDLMEDDSITISAIIDKTAENKKNPFAVPFVTKERIFDYEFDFVIVSTREEYKQEIKEILLEIGVEKTKIIYTTEYKFIDNNKNEYFPYDDADMFIKQFFKCNEIGFSDNNSHDECSSWFSQYFNRISDTESLKKKFREYLFSDNNSIENRIVCAHFMFTHKALDGEGVRKLMECVSKLPDEKLDFVVHMICCEMIAFYELYQGESVLYLGEGIERKKLNKRIAEYFFDDLDFGKTVTQVVKNDRVVIIVPKLLYLYHSPSMIYRLLANSLNLNGKKVKLIVLTYTQNKIFGMNLVYHGDFFKYDNNQNALINRELISEDVEIAYVEENIEEIFKSVVKEVEEFNPECIIDATDEFLPVSAILIKKYPIFYLPIRCCTTGYFFTRTAMRIFKYNEEIKDKAITLPNAKMSMKACHNFTKKKYFGIEEDSFLVITVGCRFYGECDDKLWNGMIENLTVNEKMHWAIVGVEKWQVISLFENIEPVAMEKIHFIGYEPDLSALYRICDVFLNLDRPGGGFSIMFAMEQGVAVATLKKNAQAGAAHCGEENAIDGDSSDLCRYVHRLYNDKDLLAREKKKMREVYESKTSEEEWGKAFIKALDETIDAYNAELDSVVD